MGRRKIAIKPLQDDRNRSVTFLKRKAGLFKKAHELAVLCQVDIAVIILSPDQRKLYQFTSCDRNDLMEKCDKLDIQEHKTPYDFDKSLPRILVHDNTLKGSSKVAAPKASTAHATKDTVTMAAGFSDDELDDDDDVEDFDEEDTDAESVYSKKADMYSPAGSYAPSPEVKRSSRSSAGSIVLSKSSSINNTSSPDNKVPKRVSSKRLSSASGSSIKSHSSTAPPRKSRNSRSAEYSVSSVNDCNNNTNEAGEEKDRRKNRKNSRVDDDENENENDDDNKQKNNNNNNSKNSTEVSDGQLDQSGSYFSNVPMVKSDHQIQPQQPHSIPLHSAHTNQNSQNLVHQQTAYAHMTPLNMYMPEQRNPGAFIGNSEYINNVYHNQRHKLQYSPAGHDMSHIGGNVIPRSLPALVNNGGDNNNTSGSSSSQSGNTSSPRPQPVVFGGFSNSFGNNASSGVYGNGSDSSLTKNLTTSSASVSTTLGTAAGRSEIKLPPMPTQTSTPSASLMRPKLKVQIPIDKVAQSERNRSTPNQSAPTSAGEGNGSGSSAGDVSVNGGLDNDDITMGPGSNPGSNTVLLLPPPSPLSMLNGGSNGGPHSAGGGPGNPFARPNTANMSNGNFNESTPFSPAVPSRYVHDLLPSPSSNFYGTDLFSFVPGSAGGMGGTTNTNMANMSLANPAVSANSTTGVGASTISPSAHMRANHGPMSGNTQFSTYGLPNQSLHNGSLNSATFNGQYSAGPISAMGMFGMGYLGNGGMGAGGVSGSTGRGHLAVDMLPSPLQFNTPVVASSYLPFTDPKASPSSVPLSKRNHNDDINDSADIKRIKSKK
ncbi:hypothetical protein NADFUDRAFT_43692 [Nadsonia fulvescens var. elongata DSM 6958]|uniref:MADS-box domain-containing protein n=1 Tax=Nadsonia fulvescens var. elongata DSM 6958 TaxID=857566 RepID=A0A1E3PF51_9ASCO|nr:hypothetical protein NADFUDRAFT_43692 [Nadsonia fulvescens var. elongata DSM 6958]